MSLTQHLHAPGPLRSWWRRHSAGLAPYVAEVGRHAGTPTARLSLPGPEHAAQVGGIVGRVLETRVEPAPPYAAILGAGHRADAALWPTHAPLASGAHASIAVEWRPTPAAGWQHLVPGTDPATHRDDLRAVARVETDPTATDLDRATAAATVAALESAYRSGRPPTPCTPEAVVDAASILGRQRESVHRARQLCGGQISGHAAPVFAPHWADGDLLLGPGRTGGYGLIDVKTVGGPTLGNADRVQTWLWQILSYAAADVDEDLWRVRAVGLWLPRQDVLACWPVSELWKAIGADPRELAELLAAMYRKDARAGTGPSR